MAGGLLQLVANGAQDVYIIGNPQITFFKVVYRKITPFTIESISQTYNGTVKAGERVTVDIERHGDLLSRIWLNIKHQKSSPGSSTDVNTPISHWFREFTYEDLGLGYNNDLVHNSTNSTLVDLSFSPESPYAGARSINFIIDSSASNDIVPLEIPYSVGNPELYQNEFIFTMWFRPNSQSLSKYVIVSTHDDTNNRGYEVFVEGGNIKVKVNGVVNSNASPTITIANNNWYFIALKKNSLELHGDNGASETINFGSDITPSTKGIRFGRGHQDTHFFNGNLSDIRYYDNENLIINDIKSSVIDSSSLESVKNRTDIFRDIEYVDCEIGGQLIDRHYGEWMMIWTDLSNNKDSSDMLSSLNKESSKFIPLQFWFCRNPGLALPLIALQYHEVKLHIQFSNDLENDSELDILCDYVFLDTEERRRYAENSHEYLIENVQTLPLHPLGNYNSQQTGTGQVNLNFNHPIKEIFWVVKNNKDRGITVNDAVIQINGYDRFNRRKGNYFTRIQRYQHHSGSADSSSLVPHMYSFGLNPEEYQPSGSCNFSMINDAKLNINFVADYLANGNLFVRVYALGYNLLRIISGMGGLAYAN